MEMSLDKFRLRQIGPPPIPRIVRKTTKLFAKGDELVISHAVKKLAARIAKFGWNPYRLFQVLKENDGSALLSGSFLLGHLVNAPWKPGDIDVFGTRATLEALNCAFWPVDEDITLSTYSRGENISVYNWISPSTGTKLQLIVLPEGRVDEYVANFDMDLVKSTFDGTFIRVPKTTFDAIQAGGEETLDESFFQLETFEKFTKRLTRLEKYVSRGFTFNLPSSISVDVSRWTELKHILPRLAKLYMPMKKQYVEKLAQYNNDMRAFIKTRQTRPPYAHGGPKRSAPRCPKLHVKLRSQERSVFSK